MNDERVRGGLAAASRHLAGFSYWKRAGSTHTTVVRDLLLLEQAADLMREQVVRDMRAAEWTWAEIGDALGITRQSAHQRYRARGIV